MANPFAANPPPGPPADKTVREDFAVFMKAVRTTLEAGHVDDAHKALSRLYNNPRLTAEESRQLIGLLDQTAGTLIYSRQHLLESPYRVQPGDTLERIGQIYNVPPELLGKINGMPLGQPLPPGTEVKVLRGPFEAQIDLGRCEMALFIQGRYAGRFPIGIGRDRPPQEGKFMVRGKTVNPPNAPPADPADPIQRPGRPRLNLDNQITIHAADQPQSVGRAEGRGCIGLGDRDIGDVFDILSVGSTVTIRR